MEREPERVLDELRVVLARAGAADAFAQLVAAWSPALARHAHRLLADGDLAADAVQDAWVSIARGLPRLEDPARFPAWAFAIVGRRCADLIRRRQRDRRVAASLPPTDPALAERPGDASPELRLDLRAAILRLPIEQRHLICLHYGEGLGVDELAAAHRLPPGTVKSRLHAARRSLKQALQGADDDWS